MIGHEKLSIELDRLFSGRGIKLLRIPKSGGVVDLDDAYRQLALAFQVRSYFYGEPSLPRELEADLEGRVATRELGLSPYSFQIGWETLKVLRVGEEHAAPSSALPLGSSRILSPTRLTRVDPSGPAHTVRLLNAVLAIVAVKAEDRIETAATASKVKEEPKDVKQEEGAEGAEGEAEEEEDDGDVDEVPYKEEIGSREVLGFIVMFVATSFSPRIFD